MGLVRGLRHRYGEVGVIALGLVVGQGVTLASTPFIARLYGPEALGMATVFLGLVAVVTPMVTLRLELLIPAASERDAAWLEHTGYLVSAVASLAAAIIYGLTVGLGEPLRVLWFWIASFSLGAIAVSAQSLIRRRRYARIGIGKATTGSMTPGFQMVLGLRGGGAAGLELGYALGYFLSFLVQRLGVPGRPRFQAPLRSERRVFVLSGLKLALAGVMNVMSLWVILFAIGLHFDAQETGLYAAVLRVLITPSGLVTASLLPVISGAVGAAVRSHDLTAPVVLRWLRLLLPVGVAVCIGILLVPEAWLVALFGTEFAGVGAYARAVALLVSAQIVAGPLGQLLVIFGRSQYQLLWDASRLIVLLAIAGIAPAVFTTAASMVMSLASALAVFYLIYLLLALRAVKEHDRTLPKRRDA